MEPYRKRAWAEISLGNLRSNVKAINAMTGENTEVMAVVKADAYGHGEHQVVRCLWESGVRYFAVSNLDEAINVRKSCSEAEILILGYTPPEYAQELADNNIIQGIVSSEYADELVKHTNKKVRCHVKLDTGMGRIGLKFDTPKECADEVMKLSKLEMLSVEGIYTHFAVADCDDEENIEYTDKQQNFILSVYDILAEMGLELRHVHFANSASICYRDSSRSTLARAGIIMYGLCPNYPIEIPKKLKPVMALKAVISHVKNVQKGDCISYGRTFSADREMKIATVTIGYADGYSRLLSSKGEILVHGKRCRIVGRVCMDQLMIDVTDADAKPGDIVTLIGKDGGDEITADELASVYGTIGYELVCGISKRVPRIFHENEGRKVTKAMNISYKLGNKLYINITNKCPCNCTFCIRNNDDGAYGSATLWLEHEPSFSEIKADIDKHDLSSYEEIIFCGYGEPTCRLDELIATAEYLKSKEDCPPLRLNTNGLSDLLAERSTAEEICAVIDTVSISLNAATEDEYMRVTRPKFGNAFEAMQMFASDCSKTSAKVMMTVVDVIPKEEIEAARKLCEKIGVTLRVRPYES